MSIPRATARLQFHKDFTLDDAVKVIEMPLEAGLASLRRIKSAGYSDLQLELL